MAPYSASNFASIWFHHGSESASTPSRSKITADSITEVQTLRSWHVEPKSEGSKRRTLNSEFQLLEHTCGFRICATPSLSSPLSRRRGKRALRFTNFVAAG